MVPELSHKWSCINFLGEEGLKNPDLVNDFSTMNAIRRHLTPPALIISASDDRLVPFVTNGLEYYKRMRLEGNDCAMYVYPTGDHGFGFGPWFPYHDQLLTDIGNWLKAHKAPKEDAIRVACIGNSITDGYGVDMATAYGYPAMLQKKLGEGYWVKNFGLSGRTMLNKGDMPYMNEVAWKDAQAFKPDVVVIKLGTNDSKGHNWKHGAEFKNDLEQMIKALQPKPVIYLCTPIKAEKPSWDISDSIIVNEIIPIQKAVAKKYGLKVIDLHTLFEGGEELMLSDGIHPNGKGAERMAQIIFEALKQ